MKTRPIQVIHSGEMIMLTVYPPSQKYLAESWLMYTSMEDIWASDQDYWYYHCVIEPNCGPQLAPEGGLLYTSELVLTHRRQVFFEMKSPSLIQ